MIAALYTEFNNFNLAESLNFLGINYQDLLLDQVLPEQIDTVVIVNPTKEETTYIKKRKVCYVKGTNSTDLRLISKLVDADPVLVITEDVLSFQDIPKLYDLYSVKNAEVVRMKNIVLLNPELFTYLDGFNYLLFEKFLPEMADKHRKIIEIEPAGYYKEIHTPEDYYVSSYEILQKELIPIPGIKINESFYGTRCEVDFSVILEGKQFMGNNCLVKANGFVKNNIFGDNVLVGSGCVIKDSLIHSNVKIGHNCEINSCLIGQGVIIEDNVRLPINSIIAAGSVLKTYSGVLNA